MTKHQSKPAERNTFALKAVRDLIKKSPKKHDQSVWAEVDLDKIQFDNGDVALVSCGTTACVAGWVATLSGAKFVINRNIPLYDNREGSNIYFPERVVSVNNEEMSVFKYAQLVLGLTDSEAGYLFHGDIDRDEVLDLLKGLAKGRDIVDVDGERLYSVEDW